MLHYLSWICFQYVIWPWVYSFTNLVIFLTELVPYFYPGISKSSTHISDFSLLNVTKMEAEAWRNEINVSKFMLWVRNRARNRLALNIPEMMKGQDKTQDSLVRWSCLFPLTRARIHCAQRKADKMGALTLPVQFLSALVSHFPIYVVSSCSSEDV